MGLKFIIKCSAEVMVLVAIEPLWDWNIFFILALFTFTSALQSNHYGIEIGKIGPIVVGYFPVAIEPLWDWNLRSSFRTRKFYFWLQSNHYGIEIVPLVPLALVPSRWLQSNHYGIEIERLEELYEGGAVLQSNHYGIEIAERHKCRAWM